MQATYRSDSSPLGSMVGIAAGNHSMALRSDGSVWVFGSDHYGQLGVGGGTVCNRWGLPNIEYDSP